MEYELDKLEEKLKKELKKEFKETKLKKEEFVLFKLSINWSQGIEKSHLQASRKIELVNILAKVLGEAEAEAKREGDAEESSRSPNGVSQVEEVEERRRDKENAARKFIVDICNSVAEAWKERKVNSSIFRRGKQKIGNIFPNREFQNSIGYVNFADEIKKWEDLTDPPTGGKKTRRRRKVKRKTLRKKSRRKGNKTKM